MQMQKLPPNRTKLSIPAPGRTIQSSLRPWETPLLNALRRLHDIYSGNAQEERLVRSYCDVFLPVIADDHSDRLNEDEVVSLVSSALLTVWLLAMGYLRPAKLLSFVQAIEWFLGEALTKFSGSVYPLLDRLPANFVPEIPADNFGRDFLDLFPYLLEFFQVHVNVDADYPHNVRRRKRQEGIFYTPSDVAEFIAGQCVEDWLGQEYAKPLTCLDPACGSGIFLLALLAKWNQYNQDNRLLWVVKSLYGIDKSWQAVQSCAFSLLSACLEDVVEMDVSPWRAWQAIRSNLAVADSTLITGTKRQDSLHLQEKAAERLVMRNTLIAGDADHYPLPRSGIGLTPKHVEMTSLLDCDLIGERFISDLFPECSEGFAVVLGNPPYVAHSPETPSLSRRNGIMTVPAREDSSGNLFTQFVEMMWRFAEPQESSSGMVIPLSIAYHSGKSFKLLREKIQLSSAEWRFAFFDRTPDSLFGDDVKTRNAIIFMRRDSNQKKVELRTSSLIRWNSRSRSGLFSAINYSDISGLPIREYIPKLGMAAEVLVYKQLLTAKRRLGLLWRSLGPKSLSKHLSDARCVFYYSTAYNWLPVFRDYTGPLAYLRDNVNVPNSLGGLICDNDLNASFVFAVLSSRFAYWLWRVQGDGFHLTKAFLARIPIHTYHFAPDELLRIGRMADHLWGEVQKQPVVSVNAGRQSVSFSPSQCREIITEIDVILATALGLPHWFPNFLEDFVDQTIAAGRHPEIE